MKYLNTLILILLIGQSANSSARETFVHRKILGRNQISGTIDTSALICRNGSEGIGGTFPFSAGMTLKRESLQRRTADGFEYTGWYESNISAYYLTLSNIFYCRDLPPELRPGQTVSFVGSQIYGEVYQNRGDGGCQKHFSENITIEIAGQKFHGRKEMIANPIDLSHCEP